MSRGQLVLCGKTCLFFTLVIFCFQSSATSTKYKTGAVLDVEEYSKVPKLPPLSRGDYDSIPPVTSLKKYIPPIGNQGESGSCTAWATAYAARTLSESKRLNFSIPSKIFNSTFSPSYIFNQIKVSKGTCEGGSSIYEALKLMKNSGSLTMNDFPYSDKQCERLPTTSESIKAQDNKIFDMRRLSNIHSKKSQAISTRKALYRGHPVIIGMFIGDTFQNYQGDAARYSETITFTSKDKVARSKLENESYQLEGYSGHAMTVIGYDDNLNGGAFEVMNSWGTDWGKDGFFWITYHDYNDWIQQAFELIPPPPSKPKPVIKKPEPNFQAKVEFFEFEGKELKQKSSNNLTQLIKPLPSGTRFRAELNVKQDSFVYVIGADKSTNKHTLVFPHGKSESSFIGKNETLLIPGPTEDYFTQLNNIEGTDYFITLLSETPVKINNIIDTLNSGTSKNILSRLSASLSKRMKSLDDVSIGDNHTFSAYLTSKQILTNLVAIEHVSSSLALKDNKPPKIVVTSPKEDAVSRINESYDDSIRYVSSDEVVIRGKAQDQNLIKDLQVTNAFEVKFSNRGAFRARIDLTSLKEDQIIKITAVDIFENTSTKKIKFIKI